MKDTPEQAGYTGLFKGEADHADQDVRTEIWTVFRHIASNPLGWVLDHHGWGYYFYYMIPFGIIGAILMFSIAHRHSLKKGDRH